ncbi:efflux RND transporter periplasmic adaptor subunit [Candidatus Omnitrophota bacterium]
MGPLGKIKAFFSKFNFKELVGLKKIKRNFIIIFIIIAAVALFVARTSQDMIKAMFGKKEEAPAVVFEEGLSPVKLLRVKRMDFKDTLPAMGNIKGYKEVDLRFQANGIVESINFEEGERIQEGDIIANLMQRDALLKLKYSDLEMKKSKKMFELGAIDEIKLEQTKLEYESARSELDKTNIYAVSSGLMGSRVMDVGSFVTSNDKIGMFIDIRKVYADFNIIEKDMTKVELKQKADVYVDAFPAMSFSGKIDRIAPIVEGRSRTQNIKVELDNKDGSLKPGMFTRALIYTYDKKDVLVIPASAMKKKEEQYFVYVVHKEEPAEGQTDGAAGEPGEEKEESERQAEVLEGEGGALEEEVGSPAEPPQDIGIVEIRPIKVGYMTQDMVEVEEGIQEDELIIAEVYEEYEDKAKVDIMEIQEGLM